MVGELVDGRGDGEHLQEGDPGVDELVGVEPLCQPNVEVEETPDPGVGGDEREAGVICDVQAAKGGDEPRVEAAHPLDDAAALLLAEAQLRVFSWDPLKHSARPLT